MESREELLKGLYVPGKIRTYTGKYLDVTNPDPDMIDIEDIAHALSMIPRFGGHTKHHFSVATHSAMVANRVSKENKLAALMHDASEAYLIDIPSPVKAQLLNYKEIEDKLMTVIAKKFGFQWPLHEEIVRIDKAQLEDEYLFVVLDESGIADSMMALPSSGKLMFLDQFNEYSQQ